MLTKEQIREQVEELIGEGCSDSYRTDLELRKLDTLHTMLIREESLAGTLRVEKREAKKASVYANEVEHLMAYRDKIARTWAYFASSADRFVNAWTERPRE